MSDVFPCPFCGEGDFDKEGLAGHLMHGHCDEYERAYERLMEHHKRLAEKFKVAEKLEA